MPFLRHEYLTAWWQVRGGGEWPLSELYVVMARSENGELVGIAPLFYTLNRQAEPALMLLGSIEISDYLDVIASQDVLPNFLSGLIDFLSGPDFPAWCVLDWYNLLDSSPTLPLLAVLAEDRGWDFIQEPLQHCPYIPLPGDWETYLAGIDKKQRHEIRRKMRRAEENELPVRVYFAEAPDRLDAEIDAFMDLMSKDPEKEAFLTPAMRDQMRLVIKAAHREGWLQLAFIEVNGEKSAAYLNFDYDDRIWVYNSGYDPRFRELSLGWVLLGRLLQWANENNRGAFDFMRGDEDYKYRFGAVDRRVVRAIVRRKFPVS
ncbi:MAG: GNAT family N-acetyltransferase [Chloroflexota bacterium]|nr:MAG: GNAT family N-acetyltransferase [Chloroflexota bacterium]